jgi:hypothetical protein
MNCRACDDEQVVKVERAMVSEAERQGVLVIDEVKESRKSKRGNEAKAEERRKGGDDGGGGGEKRSGAGHRALLISRLRGKWLGAVAARRGEPLGPSEQKHFVSPNRMFPHPS